MNKIGIKNYEEFKKLFIREDGRRQNRVILDMWKDREFIKYIDSHPIYKSLLRVKTMADLFALCDYFISITANGKYNHAVLDRTYRSDIYQQDSGGVCFDGDCRAYRYYNVERGAIFKMRIGKMYKHFIESSEFGKHLPESVVLYLCEEITQQWVAHCRSLNDNYKLYIDDDFAKIYNSDYCLGDFNSCMTDDDNYQFYENAVEAKAAYLTNKDGVIIARCVIFCKATDSEGKVWRLAERQYSSDGDEVYKRMLVHALIQGGHIDGYKKVGAGCHDPLLWMDINDNKIPDARFSIKCCLESGDIISYQDSFKWFDYGAQKAYNYPINGLDDNLSTTDLHFEGGNYDSWHEEYTSDALCTVYYRGEEFTCSEDNMGVFRFVNSCSEWHHEDDVFRCEYCNDYELIDDRHHSELTGEDYCSDDCLVQAEDDYKSNNWDYSPLEDAYIDPDDEETFYKWNEDSGEYDEYIVSRDYAENNGEEYDGYYYDTLDHIADIE